ncbi:MAG: hypothetical protein J7497_14955, partial [Chitinophagaceae bacterium]|nr:hypothetical protein [Chitinophagaceae bacterium]
MKSLLVLVLSLIGIKAISQQDISWYKMITGSIDKYPVTMHLHKAGNTYRGYYYYNSQQRPIYFTGNDTAYNGSIGLLAFSTAQDNEIFTFKIDNNKVSGEWKKAPDSLPLNFNASASSSNFAYIFTVGSEKLRPNLSESPEGNYSAASVWPTGNSSSDRFLKKEIRNTFVQNYNGDEEIGAILLEEKKSALKRYINDNVKTSEEDIKEMPSAFSMDEQEDLMICYKSGKAVSLAHFNYAYT